MITETFLHLTGIGPVKERKIWKSGISTWWSAVDHRHGRLAGGKDVRKALQQCIDDSDNGYWERAAFGLSPTEHWRALCRNGHENVESLRWLALDIETTGLSPYDDQITVIGLCGHATDFQPIALVADRTGWANPLPDYLAQSDVLITFNGRSFDIPFLSENLSRLALIFPPFHVDLRFLFRRLGFRGGLKSIQNRLGFRREHQLADVDGYMAVILWNEYRRGTPGALDTLVRYCMEDVVVLLDLARYAYDRASKMLGREWHCWIPPEVSTGKYPYNSDLVRKVGRRR